MKIDGKTKVYAILGNPLGHTFSPFMYNEAFTWLGENSVYIAMEVKKRELAQAVAGFKALGLYGGNVTIPFKESIIPYLDGLSEEARSIGAVNTLYYEGNRLMGTNTDGRGFLRALEKGLRGGNVPESAVVFGAGGAACAVSIALARAGTKRIYLVVRNIAKADDLSTRLKQLDTETIVIQWEDGFLENVIRENMLLVNTTPLGMEPWVNSMPPVNPEALTAEHLVFDLVYKPQETLLLRCARERGSKTMNGLGMLLEQGVLAFETWSGLKAPVAVMKQALESVLF